MTSSYMGNILRINLTNKEYNITPLSVELARNFLGGAGFTVKTLLDEVDPAIDPLSAENKLIFSSGPLSGTAAPCASRMSVAAKSPLTGAVGMCMTGGHFPVELKFAGYDMLIIEGRSSEPVYLYIKDDKVSFRKASKLMGTNTFDCQQLIKDDLGDQNIRVACIGPAGENLSKMACIINERRAAGRKGLGAVMGSKNLKAIAIRGTKKVGIARGNAFKEARKRMLKAMKESPVLYSQMSKHGTPMTVDATWAIGIFPANNFSTTGEWEPINTLGAQASQKYKIGSSYCYNCPVGCGQLKLVHSPTYGSILGEPEYETYYSFGGVTGVDSQEAVITADRLCDELGLDTMSTGATIAFAMELYERGIIDRDITDNIELNFGNAQAMLDLIPRIAFREGFGAILADGVRIASDKIGKNSQKYALHIKGLEMPGYDPRGAKAHGLGFMTAYTGADHNRSYAFQEVFGIPIPYAIDRLAINGKGKLTKWNQDIRSVTCDCAPMCAFLMDMAVPAIAVENTRDLVNSSTGLDFTSKEIETIGERLNNIAKVFNVLAGLTKKDDYLPERFRNEEIKSGTSKGQRIPEEDMLLMLHEYYRERGWNEDGIPTRSKLEELGLAREMGLLENAGMV